MGVRYQVRFRFMRVLDRTKVDLQVLHAKEKHVWERRCSDYCSALNQNIARHVDTIEHNPCIYGYYSMFNVDVPWHYSLKDVPDVLAVSNYADGPGEKAIYTITFYSAHGEIIEVKKVEAEYENNNRFIVFIPPGTRCFNYTISPTWNSWESVEIIHYFNRSLRCFTCGQCRCKKIRRNSDSDYSSSTDEE